MLLTVVRSLRFDSDNRELLRGIPEAAWPSLLSLTDEARLTLPLAIRCSQSLPLRVRERVAENLRSNARRHERVLSEWQEIAAALSSEGLEFAMLKGLTHTPGFAEQPWHRPQYDFDLYCPGESILRAREAIAALGYQPISNGGKATDHLPSMIRRTGYQWRGDYFDPELPLLVELHFRFWEPEREGFRVRSAEEFWTRRTLRGTDGLMTPALHPVDCLSYATWHVVRHLVSRNLRLFHVYELAHFLERTRGNGNFWSEWAEVNERGPVVAEAIAFRLAVEWFGCGTHPVVREQMLRLPGDVKRWFDLFAWSPVRAMEDFNKDELFLQLSLVPERRVRLRIAARRILPVSAPRVVLDAHEPSPRVGLKLRRAVFGAGFVARRALVHLASLWPLLRSAVRWWFRGPVR